MKWILVNENYLDYLRASEPRIPYSDYGENKFKPFFGVLFEAEDYYYITQVSHPKLRHSSIKQQKDFYKIYDGNTLIAVVNLNYMFPIPKNEISDLSYTKVDECRTFLSDAERSKYIYLLRRELKEINKLNLECVAKEIYENKCAGNTDNISKRCLDFKELEVSAKNWIIVNSEKDKNVNYYKI